jgi:hypothetical protein
LEALRHKRNAIGIHVSIWRHSGKNGQLLRQEAIGIGAWHPAKNCEERNSCGKKPCYPIFDGKNYRKERFHGTKEFVAASSHALI